MITGEPVPISKREDDDVSASIREPAPPRAEPVEE